MATRTWTGATNNNWGTATNWAEGFVPTNADDVVFGTNVNCTVSSAAVCKTINFGTYSGTFINTGGLTVSGNVSLGASVVWGTFTNSLIVNATATLTSNGKDIPNLRFNNTITITLADNWTVTSNLFFNNAAITVTINGNTLNVSGGTITHSNVCTIAGTTTIKITGTVNWTAGTFYISNPITIDAGVGTFTLSNNLYLNGNTITWVSGTMATAGSFVGLNGNVTFAGTGLTFNNVAAIGNTTLTLSNDITITGSLTSNTSAVTFVINGNKLYIGGGADTTINTTVSGTTQFVFNGTGTIRNTSASGSFQNSIEINTTGTITFGTTFRYNTGTLKYTSGTVVTTGSNLTIGASATLDTNGITWNNITISGTTTVTLNSVLTASGTVSINGNTTFAGAYGFSIANFVIGTSVNAGRTLTLKAGLTYTITTSIDVAETSLSALHTVKSDTASSYANLILNLGATQDCEFLSATDINSSLGQTFWSYKGTLTRTLNWNNLSSSPMTIASTY